MAFQNLTLVRDNSTLANFKQWAKAISDFFTTAGWAQSADTGQVNWGTIASVPTAGTYVYEIWQPNDALTTFYLKVEYGTNTASTNTGPSMRLSLGTTTNGAGTLTGFVTSLFTLPKAVVTVSSTVTQWNCYMSGAAGRMAILMWRDDTANAGPLAFGIERSQNASGVYTSTYVTLAGICYNTGASTNSVFQQCISFLGGVGIPIAQSTGGNPTSGFISLRNGQVSSALFNGNIPFSPVFPDVGKYDNPMTTLATAHSGDITEGAIITITAPNMPYGVAHTYVCSQNAPFNGVFSAASNSVFGAILVRYD